MTTPLPPYPQAVPDDFWTILFGAMSGNVPDKAHAIHVGYECLGFALGKAAPDNATLLLQANAVQAGDPALAHVCKLASSASPSFNWLQLVQMILDLLTKLKQ